MTAPLRFSNQTLWALQFLMLSAAAISLSLVVRSVGTRKQQIAAHFELERSHEEMERLSLQDQLTGLLNRRYLSLNFESDVERIHQAGFDCAFVLFDIDRFKLFNDVHGHAHGDRILQGVAQACHAALHPDDVLVRLGGDEFALLLREPGAETRLQRATEVLQRLAGETTHDGAGQATISAGLVRIARGTRLPLDASTAPPTWRCTAPSGPAATAPRRSTPAARPTSASTPRRAGSSRPDRCRRPCVRFEILSAALARQPRPLTAPIGIDLALDRVNLVQFDRHAPTSRRCARPRRCAYPVGRDELLRQPATAEGLPGAGDARPRRSRGGASSRACARTNCAS